MTTYGFVRQRAIGARGAAVVLDWLRRLPSSKTVDSVEDVPAYQVLGIDALLTTEADEVCRVEVKTDTYAGSPNLFLEVMANVGKGKLGCFLTSEADVWVYYMKAHGWVLWFPLKLAQAFIESGAFPERETKNHGYLTKGLLVPWQSLLDEVPGCQKIAIC